MRSPLFPLVLVALVTLAACSHVGATPPASTIPAGVSCADAPQLRQRAADDRLKSEASRSDHEKIVVGSRAGFFAALALVADLKCKVTLAATDEALEKAFEAARQAEATRSMYARAQKWSEAAYITTEASAILIRQLPAAPIR